MSFDDGVVVDEYCRTRVPGVYAAGHVARHYHLRSGCRLRVEHFDNANAQAMAAAKNMLGRAAPYDAPHWFWSDQYGRNLQYTGHAAGHDDLVFRGDPEAFDFIAFLPQEGRVGGPLQYQRVARSGQIPEGVVRRFFVGDAEVALARWEGRVHAMSNYCTHLDCLLSSGRATEDGLLCSCHGSVFDYESGESALCSPRVPGSPRPALSAPSPAPTRSDHIGWTSSTGGASSSERALVTDESVSM